MRRNGPTSVRLGDGLVHTPSACPRVMKLSGISTTYRWVRSSVDQRPGAPLDRGPRPLQSCIITTAGKGPGPSGFNSVAGICSDAPLALVVVMDNPELAAVQPPRNRTQSSNIPSLISIAVVREQQPSTYQVPIHRHGMTFLL